MTKCTFKEDQQFPRNKFSFLISRIFSAAALRKSSLRSYSDAVMRRCLSDSFADLALHLDHLEPAGCGGDLARQRLRSAREIVIAKPPCPYFTQLLVRKIRRFLNPINVDV